MAEDNAIKEGPFAAIVVACENTPLGWARSALTIWRLVMDRYLRVDECDGESPSHRRLSTGGGATAAE